MSRDCVDFNDRWHAAIKEAARASYNILMVIKACNQRHASLDDLFEARKWKKAADAMLSSTGREYRLRRDD